MQENFCWWPPKRRLRALFLLLLLLLLLSLLLLLLFIYPCCSTVTCLFFSVSLLACLIICDVKPVNRSYFVRLSIFRFPKNSFHCELTCASVHTAVDTEEFKTYFNKYGLVTDAIVMTDKQTGRSRGFGFITFETAVSFVCV